MLNEDAGLAADFMNLACVRNEKNDMLVEWSGADTVLGDLADVMEGKVTKPDDYGAFAIKVKLYSKHQAFVFLIAYEGNTFLRMAQHPMHYGVCTQENYVCTRFVIDSGSSTTPKVKYAIVLDTATKEEVHVYADTFILAAGECQS